MAPKILCLHGSGTNAAIFHIQSIRLGRLLQSRFELVFVDGFYECPPGPEVLPFFEGMEPYMKWIHDIDGKDSRPWDDLDRLVEIYNTKGPFVGILGFSQGAKASTHLLHWLEQRGNQLDFAVLFGGTVPDRLKIGVSEWDELVRPTIITRSIHIHGEDDPWRNESIALLDHYDKPSRVLFTFPGGHHFPIDPDFNQKIANLIISYHDEAKDFA
ncbi:serine hydrolase FSH [Xylariaceae sp. FL0255]|nr:serine hydrolase FSH [Xylariaceae sp. FL0255]